MAKKEDTLLGLLQQIGRQATGAGEAGATLASGLLSSLVGMPYGVYKGMTSDKYGTPEGVKLAEQEAADFIARNTYTPRTEEGQNMLAQLGRAVDVSKAAPIGDMAMLAGIQGGANRAAAARLADDFQQYNRQLAVPGASYAYLENTPLKPNAAVGTRYDVEKLPGMIAERKPVDWSQMEGGSLITYPTDMLSRHSRVKNVSGIPLDRPVDTVGGLEYMMDLENIAKDVAYASNKGATTSQHNRVLRAMEENLAKGGTGRVFVAPHTMAYGGENFSTTPTEGLLSILDTVGATKKFKKEIDEMIRNKTVKGEKPFADFVGLGDSKLREQLMTGAGLSNASAGDLRKVFVEKMSSKTAQKGLGFNYEDLQNAILNPNVMKKPTYTVGDSIYEAYPHMAPQAGSHPAYTHDLMGKFIGNTEGATVPEAFGGLFDALRQRHIGKPGDPTRMTIGELSTKGDNVSMFMDEKEIKRLQKLMARKDR